MVAYMDILGQPSSMELARSGHLQEIAYWLNQFLIPQGIYARVGAASQGFLRILVELPPQGSAQSRKKPLVDFICHQIWKLNSDRIQGVRIAARPVGQSQILWKQSVRISTPANRQRQRTQTAKPTKVQTKVATKAKSLSLSQPLRSSIESIRTFIGTHYKTLRVLLLTGATAAAFAFGVWFSSQQLLAPPASNSIPSSPSSAASVSFSPQSAIVPPLPKEVGTVNAAMERVSVLEHAQVIAPDDPTISLMFAGDVTLSARDGDGVEGESILAFAAMEEMVQADVAAINLEHVLTREFPATEKTVTYRSAPESVAILANSGIDVVNLANDRAMKYGEMGLTETLETLDRAGIHRVGAGRDATEARRPVILEVKGQKIAYLGYYTGDFKSASRDEAGTNQAFKDRIAADLRALREQVDWTIVNFHWGAQLAETPDSWQIDLAHFTIDNGADLIVGHHPQVLQGAQIYKDRAIAYSLGNFMVDDGSRGRYDTAVLKVLLTDSSMKVEFLPVEVRDFQPQVVRGRPGRRILRQIEARSETFDRPMPASALLKRSLKQPQNSQPEETPLPSDSSRFPRSPSISDPPVPVESENPGASEVFQPWKNTPTVPALMSNPERKDPEEIETFIRQPFVAPTDEGSTSPDGQSDRPPAPSLPFEGQSDRQRISHRSVELPPLARPSDSSSMNNSWLEVS